MNRDHAADVATLHDDDCAQTTPSSVGSRPMSVRDLLRHGHSAAAVEHAVDQHLGFHRFSLCFAHWSTQREYLSEAALGASSVPWVFAVAALVITAVKVALLAATRPAHAIGLGVCAGTFLAVAALDIWRVRCLQRLRSVLDDVVAREGAKGHLDLLSASSSSAPHRATEPVPNSAAGPALARVKAQLTNLSILTEVLGVVFIAAQLASFVIEASTEDAHGCPALLMLVGTPTSRAGLLFYCALSMREQLATTLLSVLITRSPSTLAVAGTALAMTLLAALRIASVFASFSIPVLLAVLYVLLVASLCTYLVAIRWFIDHADHVSFVERRRAAARVALLRFESEALRAFACELMPRFPEGVGGASLVGTRGGSATSDGSALSTALRPTTDRPLGLLGELVATRDYCQRAAVLCVGALAYSEFVHRLRPYDAAVATVAVFSRVHEVLCPTAHGAESATVAEPNATERLGDAYVAVFGLGPHAATVEDTPNGAQAELLKASRALAALIAVDAQWSLQRDASGNARLPPLCFSLHSGPVVGDFPGLSPSTTRYCLSGAGVEAGVALLQGCRDPDRRALVSKEAIHELAAAVVGDEEEPVVVHYRLGATPATVVGFAGVAINLRYDPTTATHPGDAPVFLARSTPTRDRSRVESTSPPTSPNNDDMERSMVHAGGSTAQWRQSVSQASRGRDVSAALAVREGVESTARLLEVVKAQQHGRLTLGTGSVMGILRDHPREQPVAEADPPVNGSRCRRLLSAAATVITIRPQYFLEPEVEFEYRELHLRFGLMRRPIHAVNLMHLSSFLLVVVSMLVETESAKTLLRDAGEPMRADVDRWSTQHIAALAIIVFIIAMSTDAFVTRMRDRPPESHTAAMASAQSAGWWARLRRHVMHTSAFRVALGTSLLCLVTPSSIGVNALGAYPIALALTLLDPMPTNYVVPVLLARTLPLCCGVMLSLALYPLTVLTWPTLVQAAIGGLLAAASRLDLDRSQREAFVAVRLAAAYEDALRRQAGTRGQIMAAAQPQQRALLDFMSGSPPAEGAVVPVAPLELDGHQGQLSALVPDLRVLRLVAGGQPVAVVELESVVVMRLRVDSGRRTFDRPRTAEEHVVNEVGRLCAVSVFMARTDELLRRYPLLSVVEARGAEMLLGGPWGTDERTGARQHAVPAHAAAAVAFLAELRAVAAAEGLCSFSSVAAVDDVVVLMRNPLYPAFDVFGPGALRVRELLRAADPGSCVYCDSFHRLLALSPEPRPTLSPLGTWAVRGVPHTNMYTFN